MNRKWIIITISILFIKTGASQITLCDKLTQPPFFGEIIGDSITMRWNVPEDLFNYFEFYEGIANKNENKPLLIYFEELGSLENIIFKSKALIQNENMALINTNYTSIKLILNDNFKMPEALWVQSNGNKLTTMGKINTYLLKDVYKQECKPCIIILDEDLTIKSRLSITMNTSHEELKSFLINNKAQQ